MVPIALNRRSRIFVVPYRRLTTLYFTRSSAPQLIGSSELSIEIQQPIQSCIGVSIMLT
jgi:hypothetical protein